MTHVLLISKYSSKINYCFVLEQFYNDCEIYAREIVNFAKIIHYGDFAADEIQGVRLQIQARQTRQNLGGGGGLQRGSQDLTKGGCNII